MKIFIKTFSLLVITALFLNVGVFAQKCKYVTNKKDPITNKVLKRTELRINGLVRLDYLRQGDDYSFEVLLTLAGEMNYVMKEGSKLVIKLSDGTLLNFKTVKAASPLTYVSGKAIRTSYLPQFPCSKDAFTEISKKGINAISVELESGAPAFELNKNDIKNSSLKAGCILQE